MNLQALAALKARFLGIARQPAFEVGAREMLATAPGIAAWGLVTGVAMMKGGIPLPLALLMSWTMYAGSAQLAVLPLIMAGAPLWVIWLTATCVNLRFVILSSMWRGYFSGLRLRHRLAIAYFSGDIIFVAFMKRYPEGTPDPGQVPYFWGAALTNWLAWHLPGTFGMLLASHVPLSWGLGFAGVLALMGVLLSMLQERCAWIACAVAATAAVAAFALPLKLNMLVAIAAAIVAGLLAETAQKYLRALPAPLGRGQARIAIRAPDAARGERHAVLPLDGEANEREDL